MLSFKNYHGDISSISTTDVVAYTVPAGKKWIVQKHLYRIATLGTTTTIVTMIKTTAGLEMAVVDRETGLGGAQASAHEVVNASGIVLNAGDVVTYSTEAGTLTTLESVISVRETDA